MKGSKKKKAQGRVHKMQTCIYIYIHMRQGGQFKSRILYLKTYP